MNDFKDAVLALVTAGVKIDSLANIACDLAEIEMNIKANAREHALDMAFKLFSFGKQPSPEQIVEVAEKFLPFLLGDDEEESGDDFGEDEHDRPEEPQAPAVEPAEAPADPLTGEEAERALAA